MDPSVSNNTHMVWKIDEWESNNSEILKTLTEKLESFLALHIIESCVLNTRGVVGYCGY